MKKKYIYLRFEAIKISRRKNWGYIKQSNDETSLKLFIRPTDFTFGREIIKKIEKKLIRFLEGMDFVIETKGSNNGRLGKEGKKKRDI